jgi:hypothetical protein
MGAGARRPRPPAAAGPPAVTLAAMSAWRAVTASRAFPKEHSAAASGMEACVRMATPAVQGAAAAVLAAAGAVGEEVAEVGEAAAAPRTSTPRLVRMGPRSAARSTWSVATTARTTARSAASFKASASDEVEARNQGQTLTPSQRHDGRRHAPDQRGRPTRRNAGAGIRSGSSRQPLGRPPISMRRFLPR